MSKIIARLNLLMVSEVVFKRDFAKSLGLDGTEEFDVELKDDMLPQQKIKVTVKKDGKEVKTFEALSRIDTPVEIEYYRNGGILHTVLKNMSSV